MASTPCSVPGCAVITYRADGVCEACWKARELIQTSPAQAIFTRIILECEAEWWLLNRIDDSLRRRRPDRP